MIGAAPTLGGGLMMGPGGAGYGAAGGGSGGGATICALYVGDNCGGNSGSNCGKDQCFTRSYVAICHKVNGVVLCDCQLLGPRGDGAGGDCNCDGGGGGGGGGNGEGICPTVCPDWCDPKYAPVCTNDCFIQMEKCRGTCGIERVHTNSVINGMPRAGIGDVGNGGDAPPPLPCSPPPGGPVPPPVISSGSSQAVSIAAGADGAISGLLITCLETGVSLVSQCGGVTFFRPSFMVSNTFTTAGGGGARCSTPFDGHNYSGGSATTSTPMVAVPVTRI